MANPNATVISIAPSPPSPAEHAAESEPTSSLYGNATSTHTGPSPKLDEYRNMIRHILTKISKRRRPPTALAQLVESCTSVEPNTTFDNEEVVDLLMQLRTALTLCEKSGLGPEILIQRDPRVSSGSSQGNSPIMATSPQTLAFETEHNLSSFENIVAMLEDLVLNDCQYSTANPRPSRPPYSMQSVLIDVATILVTFCNDTTLLSVIGSTMLPAFDSFPDGPLLGKLLGFFLDALLPRLSQCKAEQKTTSSTENRHAQAQHTTITSPSSATAAPAAAAAGTTTAAPTINIQSPDFEEDNTRIQKSSHLTIDTRLSPVSSPRSPQQQQQQQQHHHHHIQHIAHDPIHALFTPLVFFMIQYLDPYLAAARLSEPLAFTLPHQSYSIHNFHKALCVMINHKPDFYLDLLRVISHGAPDVRFRACQILFHYYNISTGHMVVAEDLPEFGSEAEIETLTKAMEQQTFEQEQQHQNDPTFLESMMGNNNNNNNNNANTVYNGINRKYKSGFLNPAVGASSPAPRSDESLDEDDTSTNSRESHIWFPHMFAEYSKNQEEELTLQASQRLSTGMQAFTTVVHDDMNGAYCKECYKIIKGYGLRCYQCKCSLHYGCLSNSEQDIMLYVKEGGIQKVVSPQFCPIPPQPRFCCDTSVAASSSSPAIIHLLGHQFILVNLYTLMLCASCCLPLWGISHQGYRCSTCNRFVHPDCLAKAEQEGGFKHAASTIQRCHPYQPLLESHTKISETALSDGLRDFYGDLFPSSENDMVAKSFEEVGVMLNVLLIQDNILQCGIASGCLLISQESDDPLLVPQHHEDVDMTRISNASPALRNALRLCIKYIKAGSCPTSRFLGSFYSKRQHIVEECVLSKEEYLAHVCAMMKSGIASTKLGEKHASMTSDYLQVEQWDDHQHGDDAWDATPQEVIDRDAMLEWLMENVRIKGRRVAEILLQHMRNLGLFERQDGTHMLFTLAGDKPVPCIFPVPYAIDCMPTVETLVDAIEACLEDIDITINECGMLLLVRRCWPDPFISRYTCERLILAILSWVFQEDEKLSTLHAEYTGEHGAGHKQHPLPGVKNSRWAQAAQAALVSRMKGADKNNRQSITFAMGMSSGAGSVYVTTRGALRDRYLVRWMALMHEMDPKGYASMLFDTIERIVEGKREECVPWIDSQDEQKATTQRFEEFVGYILKLKTCGLAFSALDEVLQRWLDKAYDECEQQGLLREKEPADIRNLAKLCSSKVTVSKSPAAAGKSAATAAAGDPSHALDVITALFAAGDTESVERGIRWLALVMHAGTGIPPTSVAKIARHLVLARASITTTAKFVELLWFQSVNILNVSTSRAVIIDAVGYLNEIALDSLRAKENDQDLSMERLASAQKFIKYSAALTCYAYNCPLGNIAELDIVPYFGDHVAQLTHNKRASTHVDNTLPMQVDESTPVIRCMLLYLEFDQLNIRADVLKMFYALIHWGFGISNKSEFISQATPALTSAIWETLPPSYDSLSDINLSLLMKLMSSDVRHFHACVFKIFEDSNWEIRYQGLDNLYGLFTKMDAAFQTKWLPMLSYLGPVFSYFVGSLWDKEEYVRSKAFALIRTFGTLHLRSAFRCWEAYFLTATDRQRTSVIKLMIQLNALFPDWQVIQWESLLEALEAKQIDKADTQSVDILERYMRSSSSNPRHHDDDHHENRNTNAEDEIEQENEDLLTIEIENARVLMLTLALQMLGSHLPVDTVQISRLKYVLVDCMGFNDCRRYVTSGEWVVTFGSMTYDPANPLQNAFLIAASRGLKKIMDSFAPLPAETVASMAPDVLERNRVELAENSSPGVHFIDVVLKLFNSGVDVASLNHMMLKIWLETILIVMYKHNILEREFEHSIVNCMKQIIELLTKEISEENKLLILEILKCLLRRSDHLTAMVLSKQIMALGKLMTKLGDKMNEPVFLKAKEFLKSAFLRFAVAGLFVLMFKNQTVSDSNNRDVDLFFVLRTVIDPEDVVPDEDMHEIVYLRDQPVRDVLDKLMKQQMERKAFSTVLHNMCHYVETVHSHPYSESILNDYAIFLNTLTKHTAGWRRPEWDINPLFTMSAILLKEHPYHYAILLPQIQNLLRHGLQHCTIHVENIVKLLASYTVLISIPGASPDNAFVQIITEEVKNGLSSRTKLHKDTMLVLLELILWDSKPDHEEWFAQVEQSLPGEHPTATAAGGYRRVRYFDASLPSLLEPLGLFLKLPPASQQFTKKDFKTYNTVAELLVNLCVEDNSNLYRIFGMQKLDETRHCLRFLNWFLLAILREPSTSLLLVEFEDTIIELLVQTFNSIPIDFDTPDINFSYSPAGESLVLSFLIVKAWVLLMLRWEDNRPTFWMSLWPALRRLLSRIDPETLSVAGNVGLSVWNLFLSLLQFLFACRSPVFMVNSYEWNSVLDMLTRQIAQQGNGPVGQERATLNDFENQVHHIQRMFVTPPVQVPTTTLNDQLFLELRDVMRLQAETIMFQSSKALSSTTSGM